VWAFVDGRWKNRQNGKKKKKPLLFFFWLGRKMGSFGMNIYFDQENF